MTLSAALLHLRHARAELERLRGEERRLCEPSMVDLQAVTDWLEGREADRLEDIEKGK